MAEISRRRNGELLRELFNILMPTPNGLRASEALRALSEWVALTPYVTDTYESGGRHLASYIHFGIAPRAFRRRGVYCPLSSRFIAESE